MYYPAEITSFGQIEESIYTTAENHLFVEMEVMTDTATKVK